jgi:hypothetical protein
MTPTTANRNLSQLYTDLKDTRKIIGLEFTRLTKLACKVVRAFQEENPGRFNGCPRIHFSPSNIPYVNLVLQFDGMLADVKSKEDQEFIERKREDLRALLKGRTGYDFVDGRKYGRTDPHIRLRVGPFEGSKP